MRAFHFLVIAVLFVLNINIPAYAEELNSNFEQVMGSSMQLKINADSHLQAEQAESKVVSEIERLSKIFSHYEVESEFSRFVASPVGRELRVSDELMSLLKCADYWSDKSQKTFNPAVEKLSQLWKTAEKKNALPSAIEIQQVLQAIHQPHWKIDVEKKTVTRLSDCPLTLNALAKGWVLDQVCEVVMKQPGIRGIMINVGGDLRLAGDIKTLVTIADPSHDTLNSPGIRTIELTKGGIATSGVSERYFEIAGQRYSHIFDPRSGNPAEESVSATIIAEDGATADVLATICSILTIDECRALTAKIPGVEYLLVNQAGDIAVSQNFPVTQKAVTQLALLQTEKTKTKGPLMNVKFEIAKSENARAYRRPYVAVWVEDKDSFPVKTLSLFLMKNQPGPRWHRNLTRWYTDDQLRKAVSDKDLIETVSKPTKNPGEYKVDWDCKDDDGKPLKPGKYTLYIEAAREHGTYQLIKQEFTLGDKAFSEKLKGNVEISAASISYQPK